MSVLLEFTVEGEQFGFGHVLAQAGALDFELERIVPTDDQLLPFVWVATDDDPAAVLPPFERRLRDRPHVTELIALDRVEDGGLYRVVWGDHEDTLLEALAASGATVLEAWGDHTWWFRVRFTDQDALTAFHDLLTDFDITVDVQRTFTIERESARRRDFGLTEQQREALVLALERGYFATPSEVSLAELAEELRITKQAVSDRLRRANEKVLHRLPLTSTVD